MGLLLKQKGMRDLKVSLSKADHVPVGAGIERQGYRHLMNELLTHSRFLFHEGLLLVRMRLTSTTTINDEASP
jgi:hypothetical protein